MADQDRATMLQKLRDRLTKKKGGFRRDPAEWRAPQVGVGEEFKVKAYILPPLEKGEPCATGTAQVGMDGLFFTQVGDHWVNKKKFPCPRVYDNDDCSYCQLGFDLLSETEAKTARSEISRAYLPRTQYVANVYFPDVKTNPEDLRGKVVFYAMPKTIFDKLEECICLDNAGDDPDDPHAWGIFYEPQDAYPLLITINRKGDYNSYVDSKLLAGGRGKIASSQKKIDEILAQRHDVPTKYSERSPENRKTLQGFVDALMDGSTGNNDSSGFDTDETAKKAEDTPAPAKDSTPAPVETQEVSVGTASTAAGATNEVEDDELNALLKSLKKD